MPYLITAALLFSCAMSHDGLPGRLAGSTVAVAWNFTQHMLPHAVSPVEHPRLTAFSSAAETLREFQAAPFGAGTVRGAA